MMFKNTVEEQLEWGRYNVTFTRKGADLDDLRVCDNMQKCPSPSIWNPEYHTVTLCTQCVGSIRYADLKLPVKPEGNWNVELLPWKEEAIKQLKIIEVLNL